MTVTLKPALEEGLAERAEAIGMTTEEFVNRVLERLIALKKTAAELSPEEHAWILDGTRGEPRVGDPPTLNMR